MSIAAPEVGISVTPVQSTPGLLQALEQSQFGRRWGHPYCVIYARAGCRCEYCGLDLTSNLSAWIAFELDHILPKCEYGSLVTPLRFHEYTHTCTDYLNLALVCRACNKEKNDFDPGEGIVSRAATDITLEERLQLIQRARERVQRVRKEKWEETFMQVKGILAQLSMSTDG